MPAPQVANIIDLHEVMADDSAAADGHTPPPHPPRPPHRHQPAQPPPLLRSLLGGLPPADTPVAHWGHDMTDM